MRRGFFLLLLLTAIRAVADCRATHPPSQYSLEVVSPACNSSAPCVVNKPVHFSLRPAAGCYIPFYPGPCPAPYVIDNCDTVTWNFNDGTPVKQVIGSGEVDHTFPATGNFTVNIDVQNAAGTGSMHGSAYVCADPPAIVRFSAARYDAGEAAGSVTVTLERSGDTSRPFTLNYVTAPGMKTGDYVRNLEVINEPVSFAAGEAAKQVTHRIRDDSVFLGDFEYGIGVVSETGDAVMDAGPVTVTFINIKDDEPGPQLTMDDVTIPEGNGPQTVNVPLHLSSPAGDYVYVWCVPHEGSARAGTDFKFLGYSAVFDPGQTATTCQVQTIGNLAVEADKAFTVVADPVLGPVTVIRGSATVTLTNDDAPYVPPPPPAQTLWFAPDRFRLNAGVSDTVTLYGSFSGTANLVSSDPGVIQVDASASVPGPVKLTALKAGTATVRAAEGEASAAIEIEVLPPPRRRVSR